MDSQKIKAINKVVDEYFAAHPTEEKVRSKDLMPLFIKAGIFNSDHRKGLRIREVLRKLDACNQLHLIPSVTLERKQKNANWYFRNIHNFGEQLPMSDEKPATALSLDIKRGGQAIHTTGGPKNISERKENVLPTNLASSADTPQLVKTLMNEKNFKSASIIDDIVSDSPGLYCIRIREISKLPKYFAEQLADRKHNIIYSGIASQSLNDRLNQELRAIGHGTFFRSIGAVLGFRPPKGSLVTKKNKRNYKFTAPDKEKIIAWINDNLTVNWIEHSRDLESIESELIAEYRPLINIDKNPFKLQVLSDLRAECVRIANESDM
jgi:hypothetical protein